MCNLAFYLFTLFFFFFYSFCCQTWVCVSGSVLRECCLAPSSYRGLSPGRWPWILGRSWSRWWPFLLPRWPGSWPGWISPPAVAPERSAGLGEGWRGWSLGEHARCTRTVCQALPNRANRNRSAPPRPVTCGFFFLCVTFVDTHSTPRGWRRPAVTAPCHWAGGCALWTPHARACSFSLCPSLPSAVQCRSCAASGCRHSRCCGVEGKHSALFTSARLEIFFFFFFF